jgi:DNA-binding XRE family transcriptional regulator
VRELRIGRSLRQSDLAKAVGLTTATIGRFEQTGKVGFDVVVRVAITIVAAKTRRSRVRHRSSL